MIKGGRNVAIASCLVMIVQFVLQGRSYAKQARCHSADIKVWDWFDRGGEKEQASANKGGKEVVGGE